MNGNYTWRNILRSALKWISYVLLSLFGLVIIVLAFFSWQAGNREVHVAKDGAPSTGRFVSVDGAQIFIQEEGPALGQPVLLIHGTGAWSEIWRETMTALAQAGFRAIAVDMPPFGYSEKLTGSVEYSRENQANRIVRLLDALGIKNVILVGHSFGARPTIEAALTLPAGRVKQLILIDPALGFQTDPAATPHFEQNNPSAILRILFSSKLLSKAILSTYGTNPLSTKKLFSSFVSRTEVVTEARVRMLQEPLVLKNTTDAYVDWLNEFVISEDTSQTSDFNNFKKLSMPVVLIWGSTDDITPLWQGEALLKLIPGSRLEVIDNVGHIPYIEDVGAFNSLLVKSLKRK